MPHLEGVKVCSSPVPVKDPFSATVKSTNYLLNALALQNAERNGYDQARLCLCQLMLARSMCTRRQLSAVTALTDPPLCAAGHLCDGG